MRLRLELGRAREMARVGRRGGSELGRRWGLGPRWVLMFLYDFSIKLILLIHLGFNK